MKRLLLLVPAFPKDEDTSYTVPFIQQFVFAFSKKYDVELDIISLYTPVGEAYQWHGIEVVPLNGPMRGNMIKKGLFILNSVRKIKIRNKNRKYHGVLSFWYRETAIIGRLLSSRLQIPHYTWLLGQDVKRRNRYMRINPPKPSEVIAISTFQNNYLNSAFGFYAHKVVPIAVAPSFFPTLNQGVRSIDILGAGSMIPLKNHELFLEVVLALKAYKEDLSVVLIGNGPLESKIKKFIAANGLDKTIKLPGLLSHRKTLSYMNDAKIFLHTSKFEGGCTVCFESLYSGCHLISTLPIVKESNPKFSHLATKEDIVKKAKDLLNSSTSFNRSADTNIDNACSEFYNLFF